MANWWNSDITVTGDKKHLEEIEKEVRSDFAERSKDKKWSDENACETQITDLVVDYPDSNTLHMFYMMPHAAAHKTLIELSKTYPVKIKRSCFEHVNAFAWTHTYENGEVTSEKHDQVYVDTSDGWSGTLEEYYEKEIKIA